MKLDVTVVDFDVLDVQPYQHGIFCSVGQSEPFVNEIVGRDWSEDGQKVIFMLETHNFIFKSPDETLGVVLLNPKYPHPVESREEFVAKRRIVEKCSACGGTGKVAKNAKK